MSGQELKLARRRLRADYPDLRCLPTVRSPRRCGTDAGIAATMAASGAGRRVRWVAAQVKPAAAEMKPFAQRTGAAAKRRARKTRAWAAPQVERSGQVLQDSVAPTVSAWLSTAARRLEPAKPHRARWRKLAASPCLPLARQQRFSATARSRTLQPQRLPRTRATWHPPRR